MMKTDKLPRPLTGAWTQRELFQALEKVGHLPKNPDGSRPLWGLTNGLRVFGWTHTYGLPARCASSDTLGRGEATARLRERSRF